MSENPLEAAMRRKLAISDLKALLKDGPHATMITITTQAPDWRIV